MNLKIICILSLLVAHSSSKPIALTVVESPVILPKLTIPNESVTETIKEIKVNDSTPSSLTRNFVRPGLLVNSYSIEIEPNIDARTFKGRVLTQVRITEPSTNEDTIIFHINRLKITSVQFSLGGGPNYITAAFDQNDDDGILEIDTDRKAELYNFLIDYTGSLDMVGTGLFGGSYEGDKVDYLAMNLNPIYARHVFPCIDEPSEETTITFTFNNVPYNDVVANSVLDSDGQFTAMQGPPHKWGMVAHSFNNLAVVAPSVLLYGRPVGNQVRQATQAIAHYFSELNEWTNKPYLEIERNQDGRMVVFALPDSDAPWLALSTVTIWEPYILMEANPSAKQHATALVKIAEAMARQWFGYVISPQNWRHQWILSGLTTHAAYDVVKSLLTESSVETDFTPEDFNTLFLTDVIQESLLADSFSNAKVLLPAEDIFDEEEIRMRINSMISLKAPAILRTLRLVLGDENDDFIKLAGASLLNSRALKSINTQSFYDSLNSYWEFNGKNLIDDISEFLEPYVLENGYPVINVGKRQGGVIISKERFSFASSQPTNSEHDIPITYTTSVSPNFDDVYPLTMMGVSLIENVPLDDEDWIIFNIQGQGYYRVNYDEDLWQRIIDALNDPDRRQEIHPLNRATLVDDALNLARGKIISYDIAFEVVISMEHETEYAVWKAFVRNMEFLRKRLIAYVLNDDDLDQNIYLRMIKITITNFESEITFNPDPMKLEPAMVSKMRGLVMEHACKAGYEPCIAAAVDWFYDPNNADAVRPDIPRDLRPAVYCTMVKESGNDAIQLLYDRLAEEASMYERLVILEAMACSQDEGFINTLLEETIATNSPYNTEERCRIFIAVAESSYENAKRARSFLSRRTNEVRNRYGGPVRLEQMIYALVDNMADADLTSDFRVWINSIDSDLDDSIDAAKHARDMAAENLEWNDQRLQMAYDWIDQNGASTAVTSLFLLCVSIAVALLHL